MQTVIIWTLVIALALAVAIILLPPWREGKYNEYWRKCDLASDLHQKCNALVAEGKIEESAVLRNDMEKLLREASQYRRRWRLHTRDGA